MEAVSLVPASDSTVLSNAFSTAQPSPVVVAGPVAEKPRAPRMHLCAICNRKFKRAEHLKRHFRRHTLERPYRCRQCLVCFARKELHSRHQKKHHGCSASAVPSPDVLPSMGVRAPLSMIPQLQLTPDGFHASREVSRVASAISPETNGQQTSSISSCTNDLQVEQPQGSHTLTAPCNLQALPTTLDRTPLSQSVVQRREDQLPSPDPSTDSACFAAAEQILQLSNSHRDQTIRHVLDPTSHHQVEEGYPTHSPQFNLSYDDFWLSSLDSLLGTQLTSPYPFFTAGFENPYPPIAENTLFDGPPASSAISQVTDRTRDILQQAVQDLLQGQPQHQMAIPTTSLLNRYWKSFWAIPNNNLPFLHEASTIADEAPIALLLGILADGAMYCGHKHVGMAFFEFSRRLVSKYLDTISSSSTGIPLWVVSTLLINAVFGLPGGDAQSIEITVGSLECLLDLADRIEMSPSCTAEAGTSTAEERWRAFIESESRKRTILCILITVRLWSAVYGSICVVSSRVLNSVRMPCHESLWTASSASKWLNITQQGLPAQMPRLQSAVESLFAGVAPRLQGLGSVCQVVGLLLYVDELRVDSTMASLELSDHLEEAMHSWTSAYTGPRIDYAQSISFPVSAYIQISLQLDIEAATQMFLHQDFQGMRTVLRRGKLFDAAMSGVNGLIPWAVAHKNQISMASVPCALVVMESTFISAEKLAQDSRNPVAILQKAFDLPEMEDVPQRLALWRCLRSIIESGPVTAILISAMDKYTDFFQGEG